MPRAPLPRSFAPLAFLLPLVAAPARAEAAPCACPAESVIIAGHRGTGTNKPSNPYPENTLPSFEQAVVEGADMIELDVMHSSDGVLVVIHDDRTERTTHEPGCVGARTAAELGALDAGYGTPRAGQGVGVPTLTAVLAAVDVGVNIEIKLNDTKECPASDRPRLAKDVVDAIHADTKQRKLVVSSFDADVLSEVKKLDAAVRVGYLAFAPNDASTAEERGFDDLNVQGATLSATHVESIKKKGLGVNVWTVNDEQKMRDLLDAGVDMIITDEPDRALAVRTEWCAAYVCPAPAAAPASDDDGGCAIGSAPAATAAPAGWLAVAALALVRRRRR